MVEVTEKSTIKIPSCVVNKELIRELGELLENEKVLQDRLAYHIDTATKDAKSKKVKDFIEMEWGTDLREIKIETSDSAYPKLRTVIDFRPFYDSGFSLAGKDPTWVNGVTNRVQEVFKKHRTSYFRIENSKPLRVLCSFFVACAFFLPVYIAMQHYLPDSYSIIIVAVLVISNGTNGMYWLIDWLFPHFEHEGVLQTRIRKWIWIILFGSGLIPAIILKLIGF
jgi:hypothetical protein